MHRCTPLPTLAELPEAVIARFWANVTKTDGCWLWTAGQDGKGYGALAFEGGVIYAHRLALVIANGECPTTVYALHKCDNPLCVRVHPEHVYPGNHADNMRDMKEHGRVVQRHGSANHNAKLTDEQVRELRRLYGTGIGSTTLGIRFGISQRVAYDVAKRLRYVNVD
jgi:hypothetical protein